MSSKPAGAPRGIKQLLTARILAVLSGARDACGPERSYLLVLDSRGSAVLSSLARMSLITALGVASVEALERTRRPMPSLAALYVIDAVEESIARVCNVRAPLRWLCMPSYIRGSINAQDMRGDAPLYKDAFVCTLRPLLPVLRERLSDALGEEAMVTRVTSVGADFMAPRAYCWCLHDTTAWTRGDARSQHVWLAAMAAPHAPPAAAGALQAENSAVEALAAQLLSVCITLGERPLVRHDVRSRIASKVAAALIRKLAADWAPPPPLDGVFAPRRARRSTAGDASGADAGVLSPGSVGRRATATVAGLGVCGGPSLLDAARPVLVICDRTIDLVTPLLHDPRYESMVHEVVPLGKGGVFSYKARSREGIEIERSGVLDDEDVLWSSLRYMHMADVSDALLRMAKDFESKEAADKGATTDGLAAAVAGIADYRDARDKHSLHVRLAQTALTAAGAAGLQTLIPIEQYLAVGVNPDGDVPKEDAATAAVRAQFAAGTGAAGGSGGPGEVDRFRLLALLLLWRGGAGKAELDALIESAGLSARLRGALANLGLLGGRLLKDSSARSRSIARLSDEATEIAKAKAAMRASGGTATFEPIVRDIAEAVIEGRLPNDRFLSLECDLSAGVTAAGPSGAAPPAMYKSVRRKRVPKYQLKAQATGVSAKISGFDLPSEVKTRGARVLIFVIGGVVYSEIRTLHELMVSQKREILLGSTTIMSPCEYVDQVAAFDAAKTEGQSTV